MKTTETKAQHTQGAWHIVESSFYGVSIQSNGQIICSIKLMDAEK